MWQKLSSELRDDAEGWGGGEREAREGAGIRMMLALSRSVVSDMGFSRQEDGSRVPCPPQGDLPDPGTEPGAPALQAGSLPLNHEGSPDICILTADSLCCAAETNTTL